MPDQPLAFHITFGTYGSRLHGDERGTVERRRNKPGDPIVGRDDDWRRVEAARLKFDPRLLGRPQRGVIEGILPAICKKGGWTFHIAAARPDHVHLLLTAQPGAESDVTRRLVKRWLSEELSKRWPLAAGERWWSVGGSVKWVWIAGYFDNVWHYIDRQRSIRDRRKPR